MVANDEKSPLSLTPESKKMYCSFMEEPPVFVAGRNEFLFGPGKYIFLSEKQAL